MAEKIKGITLEIGGDCSGLSKALNGVNKETKATQKELAQVERLLKFDPKNADLLAQKQQLLGKQVETTKNKLTDLKNAQEQLEKNMKNGTEINQQEYRRLQREIVQTEQDLKGLTDGVEELGNTSDKSSKSLEDTVSKSGKIGSVASAAGRGVVAAGKVAVAGIAAVGAGMVAAAESTREYREDMNRLDTAFTTSGKTVEQAKQSYKGFYGILGESDRSVEAVNHLAKLCNSEQELAQWTDICAGVSATFGDSLPIEGLTEAANETAKVGQVTGLLADALNWAGLSEDEFNAKLAACSTEQERSKLITETLGNTYKAAADKFKETNKDVIAAREASVKFQEALSQIGKTCEQVLTPLKAIAAEGLSKIAAGLANLFNGDTQAGLQQIQEGINGFVTQIMQKIPELLNVAMPILTSLAQAIIQNLPILVDAAIQIITMLGQFIVDNVPLLIDTALQIVLQLANAITQAYPSLYPAIAEIIVKIVDTLLNNIDQIIDAAINLIMAFADGIIQALPILIAKAPEIIVKLTVALIKNAPKILKAGLELISKLWNGLLNGIKTYLSAWGQTIYNHVIKPVMDKAKEMITIGKNLIMGLWNGINDKVQWLKDKVSGVVDKIKGWFTGKKGFDEHSPSKWAYSVGDYLMQGLANGITDDMSAEDAAKKKVENIKKNFSGLTGILNTDMSQADADYKLWALLNPDATEDEKNAQMQETLTRKIEAQTVAVEASNTAYEEAVKLTGESSEESKKLYLELTNNKIALEEFNDELERYNKLQSNSLSNAPLRIINELKGTMSPVAYMRQNNTARTAGQKEGQSVNVVQNYYGYKGTISENNSALKKTVKNMEVSFA